MKRQVLLASALGLILFFIDYFAKSAVLKLPTNSPVFAFGPFGIEKLINHNLFVWLPVPGTVLLAASLVVFVGISAVLLYFFFTRQWRYTAPLTLIWFGGAGNVLDRLVHRSTIDYIKIGGLVGNIADALVIAGLVWIFIQLRRHETA